MKKLIDDQLLRHYVQKYALEDLFSRNMLPYMHLLQFAKGESICRMGQELERLDFLVSGKLGVYTLIHAGKPLLLRFNTPLSVAGDLEFLSRYKANCNVEALTRSTIISISFDDLHQHAYDDPRFLRFIIRNLGHKLLTISNAATINLLVPAESRFAGYLLSTQGNGARSPSPSVEDIKTTKLTEISTLLGISYRHLGRIISKLTQENIIKKENGTIAILDFDKLSALANNNVYE